MAERKRKKERPWRERKRKKVKFCKESVRTCRLALLLSPYLRHFRLFFHPSSSINQFSEILGFFCSLWSPKKRWNGFQSCLWIVWIVKQSFFSNYFVGSLNLGRPIFKAFVFVYHVFTSLLTRTKIQMTIVKRKCQTKLFIYKNTRSKMETVIYNKINISKLVDSDKNHKIKIGTIQKVSTFIGQCHNICRRLAILNQTLLVSKKKKKQGLCNGKNRIRDSENIMKRYTAMKHWSMMVHNFKSRWACASFLTSHKRVRYYKPIHFGILSYLMHAPWSSLCWTAGSCGSRFPSLSETSSPMPPLDHRFRSPFPLHIAFWAFSMSPWRVQIQHWSV